MFLFILFPPCGGVIRSGFEPETHSLEGCCSIQLSYRTAERLYRSTHKNRAY